MTPDGVTITRFGYNDLASLARRHGADRGADRILGAMTDALAALAKEATGSV